MPSWPAGGRGHHHRPGGERVRAEFADINLVERVEKCLRRYDIPANLLTLEVTETEIMADLGAATKVLYELSARGIKLGIDDYGTGYSSLQYLHKLPVNELKIDRSFVTNLPNEASNRIIVRSSIQMAHSLGLYVMPKGPRTSSPAPCWPKQSATSFRATTCPSPRRPRISKSGSSAAPSSSSPPSPKSPDSAGGRSCSCRNPADEPTDLRLAGVRPGLIIRAGGAIPYGTVL